ncbi:MAG: hypothetical protein BJ554DRAFT_5322 [Olpidium bornovanus]|uniref:Uncharacterized protein n=1 Tax=Olpidium bornovanus TaxID=278681 RepID=A0A8H7ZZV4_9FUNG|nr:MAG: hypothetical protein BJ554DRAFT_5322 [Olpidium bornovanus]
MLRVLREFEEASAEDPAAADILVEYAGPNHGPRLGRVCGTPWLPVYLFLAVPDDAALPLEDRFSGLDLDSATFEELWSRLTEEERRAFERAVRDKETCASLVPAWTPWWEAEAGEAGGRFLGGETDAGEAERKAYQKDDDERWLRVKDSIPSIASLTKDGTVHPNVRFSLANTL